MWLLAAVLTPPFQNISYLHDLESDLYISGQSSCCATAAICHTSRCVGYSLCNHCMPHICDVLCPVLRSLLYSSRETKFTVLQVTTSAVDDKCEFLSRAISCNVTFAITRLQPGTKVRLDFIEIHSVVLTELAAPCKTFLVAAALPCLALSLWFYLALYPMDSISFFSVFILYCIICYCCSS